MRSVVQTLPIQVVRQSTLKCDNLSDQGRVKCWSPFCQRSATQQAHLSQNIVNNLCLAKAFLDSELEAIVVIPVTLDKHVISSETFRRSRCKTNRIARSQPDLSS